MRGSLFCAVQLTSSASTRASSLDSWSCMLKKSIISASPSAVGLETLAGVGISSGTELVWAAPGTSAAVRLRCLASAEAT